MGLFGLYFATYEMIRIGNTHMSYRGGRSPWSQHQSELLVGGIILFALVAAYRHVRDRAESRESQAIEHAVLTRFAAVDGSRDNEPPRLKPGRWTGG